MVATWTWPLFQPSVKSITNSDLKFDLLKSQRNKVNVLINNTRSDHYAAKIESCGHDQRALFNVVSNLFHKDNVSQFPDSPDMSILAEDFSQFFHWKGPKNS